MKFLGCAALAGAITAVTDSNCMILLQQARRIGYMDIPQTTPLGDATTILAIGTHTARMGASDATKLVLPKAKLYAPKFNPTEPVNVGSNDNSTPDGRSILMGQSVPSFEAMYTGLTPQQFSDFENLFARGNASADFDTIGAVFYLGDRQFMCKKDFTPFAIHAPFIGDPNGGELHSLTQESIKFELEKGWYRDAMVVNLNFNHNLL